MSRKYPKKLIEVALPLDDINRAAAREKSIRHGHPSTLHLWWARRPLAAARAVLFAQLVNDPGGHRGYSPGMTKERAAAERERLFDIIRDLVKWENTNNEEVLERARIEILKSWAETCEITGDDPAKLPPFHDPFAGGGSIPLEALRLGLEAHASDLNPVAVLINKAMIEIPPKFAGRDPVGPIARDDIQRRTMEHWPKATGLAEDVRRYSAWMRDEAEKQIGHLYPQARLPQELGGGEAMVIAWLWARTVESPNPAYRGLHVPLVSSFWLSRKKGKEAWVEPVVDGRTYRFEVRHGTPADPAAVGSGTKLGRGTNFRCILSDTPIVPDYIRREAKAGRMKDRMMTIVASGKSRRIYLPPTDEAEEVARSAEPSWMPEQLVTTPCHDVDRLPMYGMPRWGDAFTPRQLVALNSFLDLVGAARVKVTADARAAGWKDDGVGLGDGGTGATAYGDAVAVYLGLGISRATNYWSALCAWLPQAKNEIVGNLFRRQALSMAWGFAEGNPFCSAGGSLSTQFTYMCKVIEALPCGHGHAVQQDAGTAVLDRGCVISTDPPYYDNIGYAELSDYFYVWLRRALRPVLPSLFGTLLVPKTEELVASPNRHGGRDAAEKFFLDGMQSALQRITRFSHTAYPVTIYYAFKQSETSHSGTASTAWEVFLEALVRASLEITGTWPVRTESTANIKKGVNALASSVVLVCRQRATDAPAATRRDFLEALEAELPQALRDMIGGSEGVSPVAPVDLAQASIGPGMSIFSRYSAVLEADGSSMTVRTALTLINKAIDDYFTQAEGVMDADTRFCVEWFKEYGFETGRFGQADVLARAKGTAVEGLGEAGVVETGGGSVRLLRVDEYPDDWDPRTDARVPIWEACHHLSRTLSESEAESGQLLARMPEKQEPIRQLAYRLYTVCERKGWAEEAGRYNELITSWHAIVEASHRVGLEGEQVDLEL